MRIRDLRVCLASLVCLKVGELFNVSRIVLKVLQALSIFADIVGLFEQVLLLLLLSVRLLLIGVLGVVDLGLSVCDHLMHQV